MNKWMKRFFTYLVSPLPCSCSSCSMKVTGYRQDRFYVKYHALASLEDAGLKHFKAIVYESVKNDATNAVLLLINQVE